MAERMVEINMKFGDNIECIRYGINDNLNEIAHKLAERNSKVVDIKNRFKPRSRTKCIRSIKRNAYRINRRKISN